MLLRRSDDAGHIAISTGKGNETIEARGRKYGVVKHKVTGRAWDMGVLIAGITYSDPKPTELSDDDNFEGLWADRGPHKFVGTGIDKLQNRLISVGLLKDPPTGVFDGLTESALVEFQKTMGLTPNGLLDTETMLELEIKNPIISKIPL